MSRVNPYAEFQAPIADPYAEFQSPLQEQLKGKEESKTWLNSAVEGVKAWAEKANPIPVGLLKSIYERGNVATLKAAASGYQQAHGEQFQQAKEAFDKGNYADAARHTLGWVIPFMGPEAVKAGEELESGEYAKGIGHTLGLGTQVATPALIGGIKQLPALAPKLTSRLNPAERAAVAFGERERIPMDVATVTGNRVARSAQELVGKAPGGAGIAAEARAAQATALERTGRKLIQRTEPRLPAATPYTAETATEELVGSVKGRAQRFGEKAGDAYEELRQIEQDPSNVYTVQTGETQQPIISGTTHLGYQTVPTTKQIGLPVNVQQVKQTLQPLYDEMKQRLPIAQQQANPGLKAIENILNGEDVVPASVADSNLSSIKALLRQTNITPQARRLAVSAASDLDQQVTNTIMAASVKARASGGPDALKALDRGRLLTKAKYDAKGVLEDLRAADAQTFEPVKTFNLLTANEDTRINLLRKVEKQAPQDMPKLGRAYLEGLFSQATEEGGFTRAQGLFRQWQNLGDETKSILFKNPMLVRDLDNFFLLAKRMAENPNPSGTASVAQLVGLGGITVASPAAGAGYVIGANALSKLLFTPSGVRALTRGLKVSLGNKAAAAVSASEILKLAGDEAVPLEASPAMAQ